MRVTRVWIEEGCISCNLCEDLAPEVFAVPAGDTCRVRPGAEKFFESLVSRIQEAAASCPVEVIKTETTA
ncbi:MAG TPA: ferredoxin [Planctomycetota bacterium]|nr:ferredoxin [Planctomycetota bacterium]